MLEDDCPSWLFALLHYAWRLPSHEPVRILSLPADLLPAGVLEEDSTSNWEGEDAAPPQQQQQDGAAQPEAAAAAVAPAPAPQPVEPKQPAAPADKGEEEERTAVPPVVAAVAAATALGEVSLDQAQINTPDTIAIDEAMSAIADEVLSEAAAAAAFLEEEEAPAAPKQQEQPEHPAAVEVAADDAPAAEGKEVRSAALWASQFA